MKSRAKKMKTIKENVTSIKSRLKNFFRWAVVQSVSKQMFYLNAKLKYDSMNNVNFKFI